MTFDSVPFLAGALALALAWSPAAAGAQTPAPPVLRVGVTANDTYSEAFYAQDEGFFARAGVTVELTILNNGAAVSAAVASHALDVGISGPLQIAQAVTRGIPFVLVAAGALDTVKVPASEIVVAANSPLRDAKDLTGKVVAVNALRTSSEELFDAWLLANGGDPAKLRTVEMPFSEMGSALARGTVDAAVISEPSRSAALRTGAVREFANPTSAIAPQYLLSGWFATTDVVARNPDAIRRFANAIYDAARWANAHHDESAAVLAKWAKLDLATVRGMVRSPFADALRPAEVQPQLDAALKFGLLPRPVAASEILPR